ncbi:hypothetical protein [Paenibacillus lactis]|uniref:Uncharacterized protein n=2 Tax=Paenibacillus lactis TaxID=228574 RepID=G4HDE3_9BACL|nr:hypothetical protein [Paenibacillus lactis]EHB66069.1 hypothetical protein PaelaDRAFT_1996 [Paenibacillus lactis 154]MBP1891456.1 hypothetical protein [Paenibacillus lactis]GIO93480.1 hypothetical protein J31TS3_47070 [Paenibacillus lactis]HAF98175.1 hypothetical protein [Paenibacillus lactis]
MKKKTIVALVAVFSVVAMSTAAFAATSAPIGSKNNPDKLVAPTREESKRIYKEVYENTPFIIDSRTGEHLEKPNTDF